MATTVFECLAIDFCKQALVLGSCDGHVLLVLIMGILSKI